MIPAMLPQACQSLRVFWSAVPFINSLTQITSTNTYNLKINTYHQPDNHRPVHDAGHTCVHHHRDTTMSVTIRIGSEVGVQPTNLKSSDGIVIQLTLCHCDDVLAPSSVSADYCVHLNWGFTSSLRLGPSNLEVPQCFRTSCCQPCQRAYF
jgi:hypothetical protein